ncbi:MAG: helix-turn-helix domain-containing protein [Planctomycetota bacterium]
MSIRAHQVLMNANLSKTDGLTETQLRVLCVLLGHLHEKSGIAHPSVLTIAERIDMSERSVQRAIDGLVEAGVIKADRRGGRNKATRYDFNPDTLDVTVLEDKPRQLESHPLEETLNPKPRQIGTERVTNPGLKGDTQDVTRTERTENKGCALVGGRRRNLLFEAVAQADGITPGTPIPIRTGKRLGSIASELKAKGATPEEISKRWAWVKAEYPKATLHALTTHWDAAGRALGSAGGDSQDRLQILLNAGLSQDDANRYARHPGLSIEQLRECVQAGDAEQVRQAIRESPNTASREPSAVIGDTEVKMLW